MVSSGSSAVDRAIGAFQERFRESPRWVVAAPGRVNLIGEHTDYNDGFVLPIAIERRTVVAGGTAASRTATVFSEWAGNAITIDLADPIRPGAPGWGNYVRGVVAGFAELAPLQGLRAVVASDVPVGGGLSSSAALEVSVATLLEASTGRTLEPVDKARLCQRAEREFAGVPSGLMDQLTATLASDGHALLIDCRSVDVTPIRMADATFEVLIVNTNVRHDLADGEYARRQAECRAAAAALGVTSLREAALDDVAAASLDPVLARRARHVISENARTRAAAAALAAGDWNELGRLMFASHASLRNDYEVSCRELDAVVDTALALGRDHGVAGARMTGGGFGGSAICVVRSDAVEGVRQAIDEAFARLALPPVTSFTSRPAGRASVLARW